MPVIEPTPDLVRGVYATLARNVATIRRRLGRGLTCAEKVFFGHLADAERAPLEPGASYVETRPDRVAMQARLALTPLVDGIGEELDDMDPVTGVHCDHLIQ